MTKQEIQKYLSELNIKAIYESKEAFEEFKKIFNETFTSSKLACSTCPGEINDAIEKLKKFAAGNIELGNSKIKIKNNSVIYSHPDHKTYNNDTLTDEAAMTLIAGNENFKQSFDLPADFEEMFASFKAGTFNKEQKVEEPTKEPVASVASVAEVASATTEQPATPQQPTTPPAAPVQTPATKPQPQQKGKGKK